MNPEAEIKQLTEALNQHNHPVANILVAGFQGWIEP